MKTKVFIQFENGVQEEQNPDLIRILALTHPDNTRSLTGQLQAAHELPDYVTLIVENDEDTHLWSDVHVVPAHPAPVFYNNERLFIYNITWRSA